MFRMVFIVEDKNLSKVLHALQGLVLNMEPPQPVVNAAVQKGKVVQASSGVKTWERLWDEVKKLPAGHVLTSEAFKAEIVKVGGQVTSNNYFSKVLRDNGVLKIGKARGELIVK